MLADSVGSFVVVGVIMSNASICGGQVALLGWGLITELTMVS